MLSSQLRLFGRPTSRWYRQIYQVHQHSASLMTTSDQASNNKSDGIPLTKDEAIDYLENVLSISDPISSMEKSKLNFLAEVQRRTKSVQPYTNTFLLSRGCPPDMSETKVMMSKKQGGGCLNINGFLMDLLRVMGYNAHLIPAGISKARARMYTAHAGLIVTDVTGRGSIHIVETGSRFPTFDPVAVDFPRVSSEYRLTDNRRMRIFKESSSVARMCWQVEAADMGSNLPDNPNYYFEGSRAWSPAITYYINQRTSWEESFKVAEDILMDSSIFPDAHSQMIITGFSRQGVFTILMGDTCIQYDNNSIADVRRFATDHEVIDNAVECFPQYSQMDLQNAIDYTKTVKRQMKP